MLMFTDDLSKLGSVLTKGYDINLIMLSVVIAIAASFSTFYSAERIQASSPHSLTRIVWHCFGAIAMGLGIWAMHFIGMLALKLPIPVNYQPVMTLLSVLPAIFASSIVLRVMTHASFHHFGWLIFAGSLMGGGIAVMHYTGMEAMQMNAAMLYNTKLFYLSIFLAVFLASVSLKIQGGTAVSVIHNTIVKQLSSSLVMGGAISSMHYTAMAAVIFIPEQHNYVIAGISPHNLALIVIMGIVIMLMMAILIPYFMKYRQLSSQLSALLEKERSEKTQRIQAIIKSAHDALVQIDSLGHVIGWSHQARSLIGYEEDEIISESIQQLLLPAQSKPDAQLSFFGITNINTQEHEGKIFEAWVKHKEGHRIPVEVAISSFQVKGNFEFNLFIRDVTERKTAEEKLKLSARVFGEAHEGIFITDARATIIDVNPTFTEITGYTAAEAIGQNPYFMKSDRHSDAFYQRMWRQVMREGHWQGEIWNQRKNGENYPQMLSISSLKDTHGNLTHYVCLFSDISEVKEQKEQLEFLAHYDALTKLPNRVLLGHRFDQALSYSHRNKTLLGVCFLDLDDFKIVNDDYGHEMGDKLLVEVANRIQQTIRETDTVARQGGDEFALLLSDLNEIHDCTVMLKRVLTNLAEPYHLDGHKFTISASIGFTLYPEDNADFDTLLRHADQAMYRAKMSGKGLHHMFDIDDDHQLIQRKKRLTEIEEAFKTEQMELFYQPKVNMRTGRIVGAEALIRWNHPTRGLLPPSEFLPDIHNTDLELVLGEWVINQSFAQQALWVEKGLNIQVSINVSNKHILSDKFIDHLITACEHYPIVHPSSLQLEILESTALSNVDEVREKLLKCKESLGLTIALDDFGTGYSSLSHLSLIPASTVKIDRSFIHDILDDINDYMIVDGVISMAKSFKRDVIAEGVESSEHGMMLLLMGCDLAQGYGISPPLPAMKFYEWSLNYEQDPRWVEYANYSHREDISRLKLFKLTSQRWLNTLLSRIQNPTIIKSQFRTINTTSCHCGMWLAQAKHEAFIDKKVLDMMVDLHRRVHILADVVLDGTLRGRDCNKDIAKLIKLHSEMNHFINDNDYQDEVWSV